MTASASLRTTSLCAFWLGILVIASILTGVLLIATLGGTSGRDLGSAASGATFKNASLLLIIAELLKLAIGGTQAGLVRGATAAQGKWHAGAAVGGYAAAGLIAASGLTGIYAVLVESRELGSLASALAFGSVGATAIWVIIFLRSITVALKHWHKIVGFGFAAAGLISLAFAPAAMLAGLLGVAWWFGLWRAFALPRSSI